MYSKEKKQETLNILRSQAGGNVSKCAKLTGINRKTITQWQQDCPPQKENEAEPSIPDIRNSIIRRIGQVVGTCTDPKKLMDAYGAILRYERKSEHGNTTFFDMIAQKLTDAPKT